jgi:hypothetical protein
MTADEPPELPPLSSVVMDFSDFTSRGPLLGVENPTLSDMEIEGYGNWGWAFLNVAVWNTILEVTLAVPVASFAEAFNHVPVQQPDGTWIWAYTFQVVEVTYYAQLHGGVTPDGFEWEMHISREDGFQDFLWYTGQCELDLSEGTWTFYKDPDEPLPCLGIEWHHEPATELGDIKYTNIEPGSPGNGGYIYYGLTDDPLYDGFYNIYNKGDDNHTDIEWNDTTIEGRVRDLARFGDNNWHCWDSNLEDTVCP